VRRPEFIARQAAHPSGFLGRLLVRVMASETATFNREVLAVVAPASGERVLEVGFGHGRTLAEAAATAPSTKFAGIDVSADALRVAEGRCRTWIERGSIELRVGESASLPWSDGAFDKAFAVHTLYFWSDPRRELLEIARVLKRGGLLVLGFREPSGAAQSSFPASIYRFRSAGELQELCHSVGFVGVETRSAGEGDLRILLARKATGVGPSCG
jgi:ubiquinone/menaquinone biosynthesis C-methylase UbiE